MKTSLHENKPKRLSPPKGYDTWVDYAVTNMPTAQLNRVAWPKGTDDDDLQDAALQEQVASGAEYDRVCAERDRMKALLVEAYNQDGCLMVSRCGFCLHCIAAIEWRLKVEQEGIV